MREDHQTLFVSSSEDGKSMFLDLQFSVDVGEIFNHPDSQHTCSLLVEDSLFPEQFGMTSQVTGVYNENPCV